MANNLVQRMHYFQKQFLGAADFVAAQSYHRDMRRRHNLGPHTWGIVVGLELVEQPVEGGDAEARELFILPGMAVDGYGREIVLFRPLQLDATLFQRFGTSNHYSVWIGYDEEEANQNDSYFVCDDEAYNRIVETYRIYVEPLDPQPSGVTVDGEIVDSADPELRIPYDMSVPYQELPDGDLDLWLLQLGEARWDGSRFIEAAEGRLESGRRYAGLVGDALQAPAKSLTIKDRHTLTPLDPTEDGVAVEVEGSLQVERDITAKADIHIDGTDGNMLDFRLADGTEGEAFHIRRKDREPAAGIDLQMKIGEAEAGENRFSLVSGAADTERLTVQDDGTTAINGGTTIDGDVTIPNEHNLIIDGGQIQMHRLNSGTAEWGIKVEGENLQFTEPDDGDRVVFEILDSGADLDSPSIRLHGAAAATLSAEQLIDLTDGGITDLHTHESASTTERGMVEIALDTETGLNGGSGARLVVGANDNRILTLTQKNDLTDGGLTTLHRHPNGILNNVTRVALSANDGTDTLTINLGVTKRVVAYIFLRALDPLADFDSGDGIFADIYDVDGSIPPGAVWSGGSHLGSPGSTSNLRPAVYTGPAQTITFRFRSMQNARGWAEALVLYEDL